MTTISDVAKLAGVSRTTVSRVLNGKEDVNEKTRERVLQVIEELKYRPSTLARSLVNQKNEMIGVILSDSSDPYFSRIIRGVEDIAHKFGYGVVYASMRWDPSIKSSYANFMKDRTDGLLIIGSTVGSEDYLREIAEESFPLVLLEYQIENLKASFITIDNQDGAYTATKHLIQQGHRRIGHVAGHKNAQVAADRLAGYKQALTEYGIPYDGSLVIYSDFTTEGAIPATKKLLSLDKRPTAIFAANDSMAYGVIHAARELKLNVPQDLAVVGYDDIELASIIDPPLTTIHQPRYEMGSMAVWTLIQQIEQKHIHTVNQFKTNLVIRESCGAKNINNMEAK
ncbi:MAG: LacI family DNA-binding transcriptional regulator [Bacillota bacterium]|nr:LacI family DNA-binding transcriptional regulator [Bacillota bacterium]